MSEPRVYTVAEANALLPRLRVLVAEQLERGKILAAAARRVAEDAARERGDLLADLTLPPELADIANTYEEVWAEIAAMGVVVKDPRIGLLDFYGKVSGKLVCLCWKYGEEAVTHYHDLDAGFAGRKPLEGPAHRPLFN